MAAGAASISPAAQPASARNARVVSCMCRCLPWVSTSCHGSASSRAFRSDRGRMIDRRAQGRRPVTRLRWVDLMASWPIIDAASEFELERTRARLPAASDAAELRTGALLLVVFCGGASALSLTAGADGSWVVMFCGLAVLYGLAGLVEFEVGAVYTDCSLPVLMAMLILLSPSLVPWCVAVGTALGAAVKASQGTRHVSRLVPAVAQF